MEEMSKINGDKRNPNGTFAEGNSGGPGRPKGSVSIMQQIKKRLAENPWELEELVEYYLKDKTHRALLLQMIDGRPAQDVTSGGEKIFPTPIYGGNSIQTDNSDEKDIQAE